MLDLTNSSFFLPTKEFRQLSILLSMYHNPELSQHCIASKIHLSGAMVNGYIKKMNAGGLVNIIKKNRRDNAYELTPEGKSILINDLLGCSAELVQLVSQVRDELKERLLGSFAKHDSQKVVLFGAANTAQLVLSIIDGISNVSIVAIVDNDETKWGEILGQRKIQSPVVLDEIKFDCVVIGSYACQDEIYHTISYLLERGVQIVKLSNI